LVRATVDRSDFDLMFRQPPDDEIVDRPSLLGGNVTLCNAALVRHDEENEISKPAQSRKRLRIEFNLGSVSKKPAILNQGAIAIKEDGWLIHSSRTTQGNPSRRTGE
jgi:hypothetical protein